MFERHDPRRADEGLGRVDAEREAPRLERAHQVIGWDAALDGHIHVGGQAWTSPDQRRATDALRPSIGLLVGSSSDKGTVV